MKYRFEGELVVPNEKVISAGIVSVRVDEPHDYPIGLLTVEIQNNAVVATFDTDGELATEFALATLRNHVQDIAASLGRCFAITVGTWATARIDSARAEDGSMAATFQRQASFLSNGLAKNGVTASDFVEIAEHADGYHLRNALDNIAIGMMEPKFARVHFYCAAEALRISVAGDRGSKGQQWVQFRSELGVTRQQLEILEDQALRHGDYLKAVLVTGAQMNDIENVLADILSKYVAWFRREKYPPAA